MSNKVLITGGAGFIGSNYVTYVLENTTDEIFVLDKLTYAGDLKNLEPATGHANYHFIEGDICDMTLVFKLFKKHRFERVVHFAAESHVDNSITNPGAFIATNITGTFNLLQAAYKTWMEGPNLYKKGCETNRFFTCFYR